MHRSAQDAFPADMIGTWKLNLAASHFESAAPKAQFRIINYTHDGKLLVDYINLGADGSQTSSNWTVSPDGSEGVEYSRLYDSIPFAIVTLKKIDETRLDLTAARRGRIFETGTFKVAPDVLTFTYVVEGKTNVAVYRRWNMLD